MIIELRRITPSFAELRPSVRLSKLREVLYYSDGRLRYVFVSTMNSEFTRRVVAKVSHIREVIKTRRHLTQLAVN